MGAKELKGKNPELSSHPRMPLVMQLPTLNDRDEEQ